MRLRILAPAAVLLAAAACDRYGAGDDATDTEVDGDDTDGVYVPTHTDRETGLQDAIIVKVLDQPFRMEVGDSAVILGRVRSSEVDVTGAVVTVTSQLDGELATVPTDEEGGFTATLDGLSAGVHVLDLEARAGDAAGHAEARLGVCTWPAKQTFDGNPIGAGWRAFGDASWDPGGWMEITGNYQGRSGSVYMVDRKIDPGDFRIEFRIATGGGINSGADGYAVNIVNVEDVEDLVAYIEAAQNGGCLGYGVNGGCEPGMELDAFHVEFDTWQNGGNPNTDPTASNHVAITFDGDPTNHALWTAFHLEDLVWRQIVVEAQGEDLRVEIDGATVMTRTVPGFRFDGGYIGVSGSTGWATNFHRFDDLRILDRCEIPDEP